MKIKAILVVLVLLIVFSSVAFAANDEIKELYILLKPSESAALICEDHSTPQVNFLRAGGVRVTCPPLTK